MTPLDRLCALIVVLGWGVNFAVVKAGIHELPPLLLSSFRFAVVALFVVPFTRMPKGKMGLIALLALLFGAGHFGLLYVAMQKMDAASAAIAVQLAVPFSAAVAAVLYKERLGWRGAFGMLLSYCGVALLSGEPRHPGGFALILVVGPPPPGRWPMWSSRRSVRSIL